LSVCGGDVHHGVMSLLVTDRSTIMILSIFLFSNTYAQAFLLRTSKNHLVSTKIIENISVLKSARGPVVLFSD
jgi:hypothetical protein